MNQSSERAPRAFVESLAGRLADEAQIAQTATGQAGSALDTLAAYVKDVARRAQRHETFDRLVDEGILPSYVSADITPSKRTPTHVEQAWAAALWTATGSTNSFAPAPDSSAARYLARLGQERGYLDPQAALVNLAAAAIRDRDREQVATETQMAAVAADRDLSVADAVRLNGELVEARRQADDLAEALAQARARNAELEQLADKTEATVSWLRTSLPDADPDAQGAKTKRSARRPATPPAVSPTTPAAA